MTETITIDLDEEILYNVIGQGILHRAGEIRCNPNNMHAEIAEELKDVAWDLLDGEMDDTVEIEVSDERTALEVGYGLLGESDAIDGIMQDRHVSEMREVAAEVMDQYE